MNLSSYLQMPPAPSVPNSTSIPALQGAQAGAGPAAGAGLGIDFGQIMARQLQRLVPQERQSLAADTPASTDPTPRESKNQRTDQDSAHKERTSQGPDSARAETSHQESHVRSRTRPAPRPLKPDSTDEAMAGSPTPPSLALPSVAMHAAPEAKATPLQTIELSPQVRIITDPQKAPSPESLAAFAKSMGLDESTIQNLLGEAPPGATSPTTVLPASSGLTGSGVPNPLLLPAQMDGLPTLDSLVASQVMPGAVDGSPTPIPANAVVSGAGLALSASTLNAPTLPGLSTTDMAAIQQLHITVLPAAVLPINTGVNANVMPSTLDMLSLLGGTGVTDQEVSALLSQFSDSTGSEGEPNSNPNPSSSDQHASSFSQALTRQTTQGPAGAAQVAPTTSTPMGEVYDQLSDKMATELAARMHKQLSDGEWKMKFGLRPSNLGGVEIQLEMKDGKLDAVFRADNPLTRDLLQNSSQRLRDALSNFGINAGQVFVGQGGANGQHHGSGNSAKQHQVRDNSTLQVNGTDSGASATSARHKAHASLLDLYA